MKKTLLLLLICTIAINSYAQERQVPFFPKSDTYTIDKKMADKSGLFTEYKNFESAGLFILRDSSYVLEISYKEGNRLLRDRKTLSATEKDKLIAEMQAKIRANESNIDINHDGRTPLLIGSSVMGLGYYSWASIYMLNLDNANSYKAPVATYMLTAGLSFVIPYSATKNIPVTRSQASLMFHGQSRGIGHGVALAYLIDDDFGDDNFPADDDFDYDYTDYTYGEDDTRIRLTLGTILSIGEGIAGFHLAKKWNFSRGDASIFQFGGDLGAGFGVLVSDMLGFYANYDLNREAKPRGIILSGAISSSAGYYLGKRIADKHDYTLGDAITLRTTTLLGVLVSNTLVNYGVNIEKLNSSKPFTIGSIVGAGAGLYFGSRQLKGKNLTTGQGIMVGLGSTAGGLIGLGIGFLMLPETSTNPGDMLLTTTSLGAVTGYFLTFNGVSKRMAFNHSNENVTMSFGFNPTGLLNFSSKTNRMFSNSMYQPHLASFYMNF